MWGYHSYRESICVNISPFMFCVFFKAEAEDDEIIFYWRKPFTQLSSIFQSFWSKTLDWLTSAFEATVHNFNVSVKLSLIQILFKEKFWMRSLTTGKKTSITSFRRRCFVDTETASATSTLEGDEKREREREREREMEKGEEERTRVWEWECNRERARGGVGEECAGERESVCVRWNESERGREMWERVEGVAERFPTVDWNDAD